MKKILFISFTFLLALPISAEIIQTVGFNPSRFGQYERMTISELGTFKGGLTTTNMNLYSNTIMNLTTSGKAYVVPVVEAISHMNSEAEVRFDRACFSSAGYSCLNYRVKDPNPTNLNLKVNMKGGTGNMYQTDTDSFMNEVTTNLDVLQAKAFSLFQGQKLRITGVQLPAEGPAAATQSPKLYDSTAIKGNGLKLAKNDIPQPLAAFVNTNNVLTKCDLKWEERQTIALSGTPAQKVQVLALKDCTGGGGAPEKDCTDSEYKKIHKSECCPSAPKTNDGVCWSCYSTCSTSNEQTSIVSYPDDEAAIGECSLSKNLNYCSDQCSKGNICHGCEATDLPDGRIRLHAMTFTPTEKCSPLF